MGVAQSLYTGVTGLSVAADGMSIVANNIANANAKGFKRDRAEFEDLLLRDLRTGTQSAKIGKGAHLANVQTMHTQGSLKVTDNLTDLAIQGSGFLVLAQPGSNGQDSAGKMFTRAGALHFDKDGFFASSAGGRVQGYAADADGTMSARLTDIRIETNTIPPRATNSLKLNLQLDSRVDILKDGFDIKEPEKSSNYSTAMTVFDSQGRAHQVSVFLRKTNAGEEGIEWDWHALVDSKEVTDGDKSPVKEFGSGHIKFDKFGFIKEETTNKSIVNFSNGAFPGQEIKFDFGKRPAIEGGDPREKGAGATTSIAGNSVTVFHQQDGYEAGQLQSLKIGEDGIVTGVFTNGIQRTLAGIALATFSNQDALEKAGNNVFLGGPASGPPNIGMPKTGLRGSLFSSSLEESNVDLAQEFVDMITTQRAFQANSRSITTTDSLMEDIINLKR
jgi:flagellar hook protein FlgE